MRSKDWPSGSGGNKLRGNETILVIRGMSHLRGVVAGLLRRYGYRVLEASDPIQAQRLTTGFGRIDLVLLDLDLAETRDLQLVLWFQASYPAARVLVASEASWELNLELGFSRQISLLAKPFSPVELAGMVRRVLAAVPPGP